MNKEYIFKFRCWRSELIVGNVCVLQPMDKWAKCKLSYVVLTISIKTDSLSLAPLNIVEKEDFPLLKRSSENYTSRTINVLYSYYMLDMNISTFIVIMVLPFFHSQTSLIFPYCKTNKKSLLNDIFGSAFL